VTETVEYPCPECGSDGPHVVVEHAADSTGPFRRVECAETACCEFEIHDDADDE
jgi:hypothetical protein